MTIGADVGGTFTDLVWWDGNALQAFKTSTTSDQSDGVVKGARHLTGGRRVPLLVHGTTVATNALLERAGAKVALVTDPGFEDIVEIGRQHRPSLYDPDELRAPPLVARSQRFGSVPPPDIAADVIVVGLLGAYADDEPEHRLAAAVAAAHPAATVMAASDVSAEFREFERMSTAVLTAYLRPAVRRYLARLEEEVRTAVADRLLVMQSSGGLIPASRAAEHAASILLSGPAGGVVAAAAFGDLLGHGAVISFDMGGTSTDVCRIESGVPELAFERDVEGYTCRLPSVAIHTVGAGGGSVGWADSAGAMRVGPRSAGARPGPASYGRGGLEPTVTDANLLIGRLSGEVVLADGLVLDVAAARRAVGALGAAVGVSGDEAALGMVRIVEAHMDRAIRRVSVEEGFDPGPAALVAFGGAGGLHASSLAAALGMGTVLVPPHAGVLSAVGLLLSAPRVDRARTVLIDPSSLEAVRAAVQAVADAASTDYTQFVGSLPERVGISVDMRYVGQAHETPVDFDPTQGTMSLVERFHAMHERRNGFRRPDDPVEVVTVRASAVGRAALRVDQLPEHRGSGDSVIGSRQVRTASGDFSAVVHRRAGLATGAELVGPAVVLDDDATIWIDPGGRARMHESGTLVIER